MEIPIAVNGLSESNALLRALWAQFRLRYGTLGWQYTPVRVGQANIIDFGFASLALLIEPHPSYTDLPEGIEQSVEAAIASLNDPNVFRLQSSIELREPLRVHSYSTSHWQLTPGVPGRAQLSLAVKGFDRLDADFEYLMRVQPMLDQLATFTNCVWKICTSTEITDTDETGEPNAVFQMEEWIDGHPIVNGRLALPEGARACLDSLLTDDLPLELPLRRGNRHFHEALHLMEIDPQSSGDVATALLISALEAVSFKDNANSTCRSCGQPIHSINQRIVALAVEHLGPNVESFFKRHYSRRSKFLHTGAIVHSLPLLRSSQPILDPHAPEGCAMPSDVARPRNLLEFTGFIMRRFSVASREVDLPVDLTQPGQPE